MEVSAEAKRIMVVALGKLYGSRTQRGGLRLHRSLLLTLVMKSARDIYHAAQTKVECYPEQRLSATEASAEPSGPGAHCGPPPPAGRPENPPQPAAHSRVENSRKRPGKATLEPDFLPCKKAKLEYANCPQQLFVVDFASCSSELGHSAGPIALQTVIAAC